jgi:hypothetical protein
MSGADRWRETISYSHIPLSSKKVQAVISMKQKCASHDPPASNGAELANRSFHFRDETFVRSKRSALKSDSSVRAAPAQ